MQCILVMMGMALAVAAQETQHCRKNTDCPLYPYVEACYANTDGLLCEQQHAEAFVMSHNPAFLFTYVFTDSWDIDDLGKPCITIPQSDDLRQYVEYHPEYVTFTDLDYLGNCSTDAYCDPNTRTCVRRGQPGDSCISNVQCQYYSYPGRCNVNGTCVGYAGADARFGRGWDWGKDWPEAVAAGIITLLAVAGLIFLYTKIGALMNRFNRWRTQYLNEGPDANVNAEERQGWIARVVDRVKVMGVGNKRRYDAGAYIQLGQREFTEQPPAYRPSQWAMPGAEDDDTDSIHSANESSSHGLLSTR
ncbi:hypothetical protein BZG36_02030 [Bifiguratus adelaidae]|uniref:Uncharacterized protein n=1 Tax=Bifiguratus adelaidae TaxID=1938954 RepID=A0A261Y1X5_9FUNG|nr:hypothetical protein BZG36_02030 [Bifiguratus adelaidae]